MVRQAITTVAGNTLVRSLAEKPDLWRALLMPRSRPCRCHEVRRPRNAKGMSSPTVAIESNADLSTLHEIGRLLPHVDSGPDLSSLS